MSFDVLLVCDIFRPGSTVAEVRTSSKKSAVLVVVNSSIYGGGGGGVGVFSLDGNATEIAMHEMGHTAYGLADEYALLRRKIQQRPGNEHHPPTSRCSPTPRSTPAAAR